MTRESLARRVWGLRRPRRLASVVLRRLGLSHLMTIRSSGLRLKFFPTINLTYLWEDPDFFAIDTDFLRALLRPGDVMIDCGANIGQLALFGAKCVAPGGIVYAIEAHPTIFGYLRRHTEMNDAPNVTLIHAAVGEKEGSINFSDMAADDGNHVVPSGSGLTVPMHTLDSLIPAGTAVKLLKIDVEGYEKLVFEGAPRVLAATECVFFESSSLLFERYGYGCEDVYALLRNAGFTLFRWRGKGIVETLPPGYASGVATENLVAVRDRDSFLRMTGFTLL